MRLKGGMRRGRRGCYSHGFHCTVTSSVTTCALPVEVGSVGGVFSQGYKERHPNVVHELEKEGQIFLPGSLLSPLSLGAKFRLTSSPLAVIQKAILHHDLCVSSKSPCDLMWVGWGIRRESEREERRGGEVASISLFLALVHLLLPCFLLGGRTNGGITALGALGVGLVHNPGLSVWACHFMNILSHVCYHLNSKSI